MNQYDVLICHDVIVDAMMLLAIAYDLINCSLLLLQPQPLAQMQDRARPRFMCVRCHRPIRAEIDPAKPQQPVFERVTCGPRELRCALEYVFHVNCATVPNPNRLFHANCATVPQVVDLTDAPAALFFPASWVLPLPTRRVSPFVV